MSKEVMQMALNVLLDIEMSYECEKEIKAIRTALAQPEQYDQTELELCKKCGWKAVWPDGCLICEKQEALAKSKEWIGLTSEEIREGNRLSWITTQAWESAVWWAEAKLKEKNG